MRGRLTLLKYWEKRRITQTVLEKEDIIIDLNKLYLINIIIHVNKLTNINQYHRWQKKLNIPVQNIHTTWWQKRYVWYKSKRYIVQCIDTSVDALGHNHQWSFLWSLGFSGLSTSDTLPQATQLGLTRPQLVSQQC